MRIRLLPFLLLLLICSTISQAQNMLDYKWVHPAPTGNFLYGVKMWDANNWYVAGGGGTFMKTTDAGNTWDIKKNILKVPFYKNEGTTIYDMHFFDMNTGYVCSIGKRLGKTTDGGQTWDTSSFGVYDAVQNMYWLNKDTGFFSGSYFSRTTDGGQTFTHSSDTAAGYSYYNVYAKDINNLLSVGVGGIFKSTNGGANWFQVASAFQSLFAIEFYDENTGYAVGWNQCFVTTNGGNNWADIGSGISEIYYNCDIGFSSTAGKVYVLGNDTLIYEGDIDSFSGWTKIPIKNPAQKRNGEFTGIDVSYTGDTILAVGEFGLINQYISPSEVRVHTKYLKTGLGMGIWAENGHGRVIQLSLRSSSSPTVNDQVMYSTDGGKSWSISNCSAMTGLDVSAISMINNMTGYVTGWGGKVFKTSDGGVNWVKTIADPQSGYPLNNLSFHNENTGYVFGDRGLGYKTTNGGGSWNVLNTGFGLTRIHSVCFINENTGWIGGNGAKLFKTTDGGATFVQQNGNLTKPYYINSISMLDANTGWLSSYGTNVRKTTDGGANWDSVNVPFYGGSSGPDLYGISFFDESNGVAISYLGYIYKTSNGGDSWDYGFQTASFWNRIYMTSADTGYISGGSSGVLKLGEGTTSIGTFTNTVPDKYMLYQNYPNPFNPVTTIKFGLPRRSNVSLKIYDLSGREVAVLFNNQSINPGELTYNFDGSTLASGIYFYSLIIDNDIIDTKKMVLVK